MDVNIFTSASLRLRPSKFQDLPGPKSFLRTFQDWKFYKKIFQNFPGLSMRRGNPGLSCYYIFMFSWSRHHLWSNLLVLYLCCTVQCCPGYVATDMSSYKGSVLYCAVLSWLCGNWHVKLQGHKDNWWRFAFVLCIVILGFNFQEISLCTYMAHASSFI